MKRIRLRNGEILKTRWWGNIYCFLRRKHSGILEYGLNKTETGYYYTCVICGEVCKTYPQADY